MYIVVAEKYDAIYDRIAYLIGLKTGITFVFSLNFAKTKIYSYGSLPLGEIIIGIKLVFNKYQNHYCYITFFLEKCLYHVAEKWQKTFLQHIDGGIWWDKSSKARRKNKKRDVDVNNMVIIVIQYIWRWKLKKY